MTKKVTELPAATTPLAGADILLVVQGGVSKQSPVSGLPSSGGGLTNLTEAKNTAAPNATVPVVSLSVTIAETNGDVAIATKGTGATLAQVPTNSNVGGNKRGTYATDWQKLRSSSDQVASGNSSTIAGGENNRASALASTVGGGTTNAVTGTNGTIAGGDSGTVTGNGGVIGGGSANGVLGDYGVLAGGQSNTINNGTHNVLSGGSANTIQGSGTYQVISGGRLNNNQATGSTICGGESNTTAGAYSTILGGLRGTDRANYGVEVRANGRFSADGDAQRRRVLLRRATTDATASVLSADGAAPSSTTQISLTNNSAYGFRGNLIARNASNGDCSHWEFKGTIRRGANAAATSLVAAVTPAVVSQDAGASTWAVSITADTTNGALAITVTGVAATNIKWVADVETVEVAG